MFARIPRSPVGYGDEGLCKSMLSAEPTPLIKNPPRYPAFEGGVGFIFPSEEEMKTSFHFGRATEIQTLPWQRLEIDLNRFSFFCSIHVKEGKGFEGERLCYLIIGEGL